jgi:leucyl-tRNA synthetase
MVRKYQPQEFEKKWMDKWESDKTYESKDGKKKQYVLAMFPYPSGAGLHVGHVRNYTGTDVVARYYRMNGYSVMHPMGWDAFGLPAENAAIKAKKNPMDMVPEHIATFKRQMKSLGFSYDWDREFTTTDPAYYKWTQWLFIQFYRQGLLYRKDTPINYCPVCKTGLAEEEVLPNGTHERCGNKITKKDLPQWIFKITSYADRLLKDLEGLDWPEGILAMQRNWIGKKEGINIDFKVVGHNEKITVFTTAPTNWGASFMVLAPEHELVKKVTSGKFNVDEKIIHEINKYVELTSQKSEIDRQVEGKEKTGVFSGLYVKNHVTNENIPVWISDFVLANFGTGAIQACPGHDIRDFEFAQKYNLPIPRVVVGPDGDKGPIDKPEKVIDKSMPGTMINSDFIDGLSYVDGLHKTMDYFEEKGWGKRVVTYHLRDWIFSRQRYWGEPIPMVNCEKCGWQPVSESELPLKLPYLKSYEPGPTGESPLSSVTDWVDTKCPKCQGPAKRETDTMPNWAGSCWYFLRFADPKNEKEAWSIDSMKKWQPVDWYLGGAEHAVLHLLYSRFWVKALYDLKLLGFKEPFLKLRNQGMILAEDHRKMSKSFGNVINPDTVVSEYGADALRIYEMFMAPFNTEIPWSTKALQGSYRFIKRVWDIYQSSSFKTVKSENKLAAKLQKTINKITRDIPEVKFNTSIAAMMEFLNDLEKNPEGLSREDAMRFLQVLAPFAPFMAEELWSEMGEKTSIHLSTWPKYVEGAVEVEVIIPVQVMGKLRATIKVQSDQVKDQQAVEKQANNEEKVKKYLEGKEYRVIYIPGKILNYIIK